jgi:hypothetical protein
MQSYFIQWKLLTEERKIHVKSELKMKILRLYLDKLAKGFSTWKRNHDGAMVNGQNQMKIDMEEDGNEMNS